MIKFVVFDFDGVFTDGKCWFNGSEINKFYNVKDGQAVGLLKTHGITCGLISSYSDETSTVKWNSIRIDEQLSNHLKFDYVSIGHRNKLATLKDFMRELNLCFSEVAYIGDDIGDIEILSRVGLSACPNDAVDSCKDIVDYICEKNGGEGCVREFVDYVISKIDSQKSDGLISETGNVKTENNNTENFNTDVINKIIEEIREDLLFQLDNFTTCQIQDVCEIVRNCKGNVYFTGVGKSKNSALECCALLKSIGIKSFYIDPIECLHGDVGVIRPDDVVFMYSKSGSSDELVNLLEILKNKKCFTIGVHCDQGSFFEKDCSLSVKIPFKNEIVASSENNKIPTNSFMSQIIFSNIIVSVLKNDITMEQYRSNHPGGNIGRNLKSLKSFSRNDYPIFVISNQRNSINLFDIFLEMTNKKIGCAFFVDEDMKLLGILTDGDIRRLLMNKHDLTVVTVEDINTNYYYETDINKFVSDCKKTSYIPILNDEKKIVSVCNIFS